MIDTYLAGTEVKFLISEINLIFQIAGFHPYFVQMACHHLYAAHQQGVEDATRRKYVSENFQVESYDI